MNKLKNMKIFCYIITFEEKGSKYVRDIFFLRDTFGIFNTL